MFGREVQLPIDVMFGLPTDSGQSTDVPAYVKELRMWLNEAYERVRQHSSVEQKRHKQLYDTKVAGNPFVKGDKVWLHIAAVPRGHSKKLHRFWKGPYTVMDVLSNCVYKIKQDTSPHKQHTVHFDRLKPYVHRSEQGESGPTQQDYVPEEMRQEDKEDAEERRVPQEEEDDIYDMLVVKNRDEPADAENQEPLGDIQENPAMEDDIQDDDMEPQQVEQVPLRRSSRKRQPPERLGNWMYF